MLEVKESFEAIRDAASMPGGGWGDENLKGAVCRMVALGATVAMRRGVWGARVCWKLACARVPPSSAANGPRIAVFSPAQMGALRRKQQHEHTRPRTPRSQSPKSDTWGKVKTGWRDAPNGRYGDVILLQATILTFRRGRDSPMHSTE